MKKIVPPLLTLSMLIALSACSSGNNSTVNPSTALPSESLVPEKSANSSEISNLSIDAYSWNYDTNEDYLVTCEGSYSGEVVDGVPNGYGRFDSQNDSGDTWYYEGYFKNGRFDGQGGVYWSDGYSEVGTYIDGAFRPTYPEILEYYSKYDAITFNMNSSSKSFVEEHPDLFPATTEQASTEVDALIDPSIGYPQIEKSLTSVQGKLCLRENTYVIQVGEINERGSVITTLLVGDENGDYFYIIYNGSLPDVYSDMYLDFVGLPIAITSFDNIGGGVTNTAVIAGSSVLFVE